MRLPPALAAKATEHVLEVLGGPPARVLELGFAGIHATPLRLAGFEVVELSGHAPGLIGLWRASDRVALVSDCFYMVDLHGRPQAPAVPAEPYNLDTAQSGSQGATQAATQAAAHSAPVYVPHDPPPTTLTLTTAARSRCRPGRPPGQTARAGGSPPSSRSPV